MKGNPPRFVYWRGIPTDLFIEGESPQICLLKGNPHRFVYWRGIPTDLFTEGESPQICLLKGNPHRFVYWRGIPTDLFIEGEFPQIRTSVGCGMLQYSKWNLIILWLQNHQLMYFSRVNLWLLSHLIFYHTDWNLISHVDSEAKHYINCCNQPDHHTSSFNSFVLN